MLPDPTWHQGRGGRHEKHCRRVIVDAILYLMDNGIKWRALPDGLQTVRDLGESRCDATDPGWTAGPCPAGGGKAVSALMIKCSRAERARHPISDQPSRPSARARSLNRPLRSGGTSAHPPAATGPSLPHSRREALIRGDRTGTHPGRPP
ncbi:transposase [Kutzneria viridogrisea]|uniref:transposase n=1 Tax=Kutzneria TaxID=43356 RepID=UPI0009DCF489